MARNKIRDAQPRLVHDATPPDVVAKIDAIVEKYTDRAGMLIGALQDVQNEFNYLRQDAMMYLAEKAGLPLSQLFALARFYNAFSLTPRGEHIIRVCLGTACHLKGGGSIADAITRELGIDHGETTKDMLFTLERVNCLGACALAPVVTINNKYYGKMTVGKMMKLIEERSKQDQPPAQPAEEPALAAV
jgi:NADH-quinone oxidoreductase subunit E